MKRKMFKNVKVGDQLIINKNARHNQGIVVTVMNNTWQCGRDETQIIDCDGHMKVEFPAGHNEFISVEILRHIRKTDKVMS